MKITYSSDKINPFGGLSFVDKLLSNSDVYNLVDNELGSRSVKAVYSYADIIKSLWMITLSGGDCAEDITEHFRQYLNELKDFEAPSADTLLRVQKELATEKEIILSQAGVENEINTNDKMNHLMVSLLVNLKQLSSDIKDYTLDFDHQFIPTEKYDSKRSYKKADGYFPGIASINNMPVYIENRNGNSNVKFEQEKTLEKIYSLLLEFGLKIKRSRMDCGSFAKNIVKTIEANSEYLYIRAMKCDELLNRVKQVKQWKTEEIGFKEYQVASIEYKPFGEDKAYRYVISREKNKDGQTDLFTEDNFIYRAIMTNDREKSDLEVILFYNKRGNSERLFDEMNNDFNWSKLPFSFLQENTVFMTIMAMCRNIFHYLTDFISKRVDFVKPYYRLKKFIFRFMIVPVKWIRGGGQDILKVFSSKNYHLVLK